MPDSSESPLEAAAETTASRATDAFKLLSNETRLAILLALWESDDPLRTDNSVPFSELFERVGVRDSGNFTYHLDQLAGDFVEQTEDGYELKRAGYRVVEAVLSGAVVDAPVLERTRIDEPCHYCGAPSIEMSYREGQLGMYCPRCGGTYAESSGAGEPSPPSEQERLGYLHLPPAGVESRTPREALHASFVWVVGELGMAVNGVCPRCGAPVENSLNVCTSHDTVDEHCDHCDRRYAATVQYRCTNCVYVVGGILGTIRLLPEPDLRTFLIDHGFDPVAPSSTRFWKATQVYDEDIRGTDPFEAQFTFTVDGDTLALTVDDDLSVIEIAKNTTSEAA